MVRTAHGVTIADDNAMADEPDADDIEASAEHGEVPEDMLELFEILEWQAAVGE